MEDNVAYQIDVFWKESTVLLSKENEDTLEKQTVWKSTIRSNVLNLNW
jgi:hypothetical protein